MDVIVGEPHRQIGVVPLRQDQINRHGMGGPRIYLMGIQNKRNYQEK
jgi:hypothetical protein